MLTPLTQIALAVLNGISCGEVSACSASFSICPHSLSDILVKLESHGLIALLPGQSRGTISSYTLARPATKITLLDILEATGESLNCNTETYEEMYFRYGIAARKLGIINHITRQYLSEIRLTDL